MAMPNDQTHPKKVSANNRRWARRFALQALYQWLMSAQSIDMIEKQYLEDKNIARADTDHFHDIIHGVATHLDEIEIYLKRYVDRPLVDIDPIELTILRIATYELLKRLDVPYRVAVNEALELGKTFGATDGYKFVNGILDKIAREVRRDEIAAS